VLEEPPGILAQNLLQLAERSPCGCRHAFYTFI
jgi:hypothetical protein